MICRRALMAGVATICLLLLAGQVQAEVSEGAITVTPQVGGYLFEGDQNLDHGPTFGIGLGYLLDKNWGAELIFNYIATEFDSGGGDVDGYLYRFDGLYYLMPDSRLIPYLAAGIGGITQDPDRGGGDTDPLVNYGLGLKYFLTDSLALRGDVRHIISFHSFDDTENNLAYTVGLTFFFGGKKIEEKQTVEMVKVVEELTAAAPVMDSDGDGVPDDLDRCPDTPVNVAVDSSGCPLDTDGDGVYDYLDKCPDTPAGVGVDDDGCPLDTDGDGVYDYLDRCPDTPKGLRVDSEGCPILMREQVSIQLNIEFDVNKADIKPQYHEQFREVADFLDTYLKTRAIIEGHTDSTGSAMYNQKLSERRAESVRQYLIDNFGISPERLEAKGFGEERPIAANATSEGRQKNRRVVAVISTIKEEYQKKP